MVEARYKIVFEGEPMPGVALETVKENLARLFKSDSGKIDSLFSGRSVALKRDLDEAEADKYLAALQRAGAMVRKEQDRSNSPQEAKDEPAPMMAPQTPTMIDSMRCPKCGHEQPKTAECQACGIIIDKYLARQAQLATEASAVQGSITSATAGSSPYAPPQAQVGEVLPEYGELKVLSTDGRIGRVRYLGWSMALILAFLPVGAVIAASFALSSTLASLLAIVACIVLAVVGVFIGVQRLHDIGWSGWLWLINFVPFVGSVFALIMLVVPGTSGPNRYGSPPPPNSLAVKVLACLVLLAPIVIGIFSAIAIPAYQDYVSRAQLTGETRYEQPADTAIAPQSDSASE
ncbi:DUF805 domain-containing protein [Pseudomonas boanensis]|uniref:DUF805 domain-containing protein n=1 Tax=Metapseudomonas boanensis TaxID=2822138 RepID=UPI0035D434C7